MTTLTKPVRRLMILPLMMRIAAALAIAVTIVAVIVLVETWLLLCVFSLPNESPCPTLLAHTMHFMQFFAALRRW